MLYTYCEISKMPNPQENMHTACPHKLCLQMSHKEFCKVVMSQLYSWGLSWKQNLWQSKWRNMVGGACLGL